MTCHCRRHLASNVSMETARLLGISRPSGTDDAIVFLEPDSALALRRLVGDFSSVRPAFCADRAR